MRNLSYEVDNILIVNDAINICSSEKFLKDDDKIKVDIVLKGRERQHPEKAAEMINKFIDSLKALEGLNVVAEQSLTRQGGRFNIVLMNKK